jgi:NADPH:quinone reductase-like Zn-dependent oxidoreductase
MPKFGAVPTCAKLYGAALGPRRSAPRTPMNAVIHHAYGPADQVLSVEAIARPIPKDQDVLVRVRAASMHADVWHVLEGVPYVLRLMGNGVRRPKIPVPGTDLSGVVEAIGAKVTRFKPGDEVFGESAKFGWMNGGAYAEYAAVPERFLALKPHTVTFEQAAAAPTAGFIALNSLGSADKSGLSILINGAGGAMGTLAIQIARAQGARVTAVDRADKLPMLRSRGADRVIDYATEDYLKGRERYDLIVDVVGLRRPRDYRPVLTSTGRYVPIGHWHYGRATEAAAAGARWLGNRVVGNMPYFVAMLLLTLLDPRKRRHFEIRGKLELTTELRRLLESGALTPIIGRTFALEEVPAAVLCMQEGKTLGRIVITP